MSISTKQFVFVHNEQTFIGRVFTDDHQEAPWVKNDGHGPVRETRGSAKDCGKRAGERILHSSRGTVWLYNWQEACKMARRDGWNAEPYDAPNRVQRAVQADFDRLQAWLKDEWCWIGVGVVKANTNGEFPNDDDSFYRNAVWGIESDSEYYRELACEIAGEILAGSRKGN